MNNKHYYPDSVNDSDFDYSKRIIHKCNCCGEEIMLGEKYYLLSGEEIYCKNCVEEKTAEEE